MARIEVPMPQMGESIAEGTVSKWLKKVGEKVQRDEALLEISTDKVDAEIPSPSDGVLVEVLVRAGETVEVGTTVAFIDPDAVAGAGLVPAESGAAEPPPESAEFPTPEEPADAGLPAVAQEEEALGGAEAETAEDSLRTRSTPVVRRIAEEHGVDLAQVPGSGHAGRVTKDDILSFIEAGVTPGEPNPPKALEAAPAPASASPIAPQAPPEAPSDFWKTFYGQVRHPEFPVRSHDRVEAMDKIRRLTAEHMVVAKRISPHVHSFIEIDFTRIDSIRKVNKVRWAEQGAKVSFTAFVVWALSRVLREFPMVNGTISGNNLIYRGNVNVGVAVDLDPGLIVPVIHDADELSLVGIGKRIVDLADRARSRRLIPEEIQGATFSITNPGVLGTLVGMPIIPKGTNGILGTGAIEKRVVVVEDPVTGTDSIAIRKRSLFSLGYDHRMVDGADAARFLARLKELMENFPEDA
ncbi:MAG: 2-oxo acid dehydrogenase subunit E2 [Longimicrobiales bacterium]|nr:2-oxo acid dehydrogenase subunit E2 [Longimicrobiales bacterium]